MMPWSFIEINETTILVSTIAILVSAAVYFLDQPNPPITSIQANVPAIAKVSSYGTPSLHMIYDRFKSNIATWRISCFIVISIAFALYCQASALPTDDKQKLNQLMQQNNALQQKIIEYELSTKRLESELNDNLSFWTQLNGTLANNITLQISYW
eukprot:117341_1